MKRCSTKIFSPFADMGVSLVQCKTGEELRCLKSTSSCNSTADGMLYTQVDFHREFGGRRELFCKSIMFAVLSNPIAEIVLINPFDWRSESDGDLQSSDGADSDSDAEDSSFSTSRRTADLLLSLISWFVVHSNPGSQRLTLICSQQVPRYLLQHPRVQVTDALRSPSSEPASAVITVGSKTVPGNCGCILIRGPVGSGKTQALFDIDRTHKVSWLYVHEIVNCELGESGQIIRRAFSAASSSRSGIVVMDDADLILNTSGRIMKEVVEEISACISEFAPRTKFIFSMDSGGKVDEIIFSKVDFTIDL